MTENDSFEDIPVSKTEMIQHGLKIGADNLFICIDSNGTQEAVYSIPGDCSGSIEKSCWRASYHVNTISLDEYRQKESAE